MRNYLIDRLCEEAKINENLVVLVGDLGYGCFEKFSNQYPDRFFNCGIAEQSMMGIAAGLAKEGKKVFVYSIGNFPSLRCIEQIRNDICYTNLDVNIISIGSGLEYGQLGTSHHATEDYSIVSALPNIQVYIPANREQLNLSLNEIFQKKSPSYIKLNKNGIDNIYFTCGDVEIDEIYKGKDIAIISTGTIIEECFKCIDKNSNIALYSVCKAKPLNESKIVEVISKYKTIIILEEHNKKGGIGEYLASIIATNKSLNPNLEIIAINNEFAEITGDREYLRKILKIDSETVKDIININRR